VAVHLILLVVFWGALLLGAWTWAGYPMLLWGYASLRARQAGGFHLDAKGRDSLATHPRITIIVPVFNGEDVLATKIENCLSLDYPAELVEVIVASDGSTDKTAAIAHDYAGIYPNIRLVESSGRLGKSGVQNLAASVSTADVLLLTDVESSLRSDALMLLSDDFAQADVGCVTGHVVWGAAENLDRARSENLYWRFEHGIWAREARLGILACASGTCMAVRRELFQCIDPRYGDDVVLPLDVLGQGFRNHYEAELIVFERSTEHSAEVLKARSRMTLRSLKGTVSRRRIFAPVTRPMLCLGVLSHKILRWLTPFMFMALLVAAGYLALDGLTLARVVVALQCSGIAVAAAGYLSQRSGLHLPVLRATYELAVENLGMLIGVTRAVVGRHEVAYRSESR
jgi:cellulose synthase/poly-beta-1,6-N-acetylglucosamine synthase-like glycosyltransferase